MQIPRLGLKTRISYWEWVCHLALEYHVGNVCVLSSQTSQLMDQIGKLSKKTTPNIPLIVSSSPPTLTQKSHVNTMQNAQPSNNNQHRDKKKKNRCKMNNIGKWKNPQPNTYFLKEQGRKNKHWYPCTTCQGDHAPHQFPYIEYIHKFMAQQWVPYPIDVLTSPCP